MTFPSHEFSATEICIAAFYTYCGFFAANFVAHITAANTVFEAIAVTVASVLSWAALARIWLKQDMTRGHPVNVVLLLVAMWIGLETLATII